MALSTQIDRSVEDVANLSGDPIANEARRFLDNCQEWYGECQRRFVEDIKFAWADSENGYQWPNNIRSSRDIDMRPSLTINIVRQHNLMIRNQSLQAKADVRIIGTGGGASAESAQAFKWLVQHIEYQSNAQAAYKWAQKFQVDGGWGWWRIVTEWASPDSFDQEIFIRPVWDPLSVVMDPDARQQDRSDARKCVLFDMVPKDEFDSAYPELRSLIGNAPLGDYGNFAGDWIPKNHIMIAEYFRKVPKLDTLASFLFNGQRHNIRVSEMPENIRDEILNDKNTKTRDVVEDEIEWYLIAGEQVIDQTVWPGKYIPLVQIIGEEGIVNGVYDCKGHTRAMKDAQRMFNYNALLALDTKIPIPSGWTTVGELQDGDLVFDQNGNSVPIKKVLPVHTNEECVKITFDNDYSVVTDKGHIWKVEERGRRYSWGTDWESRTLCSAELRPKDHFIILPQSIALPDNNFELDPYVLGLWLGDGHSSSGRMSSHIDDANETKALIEELGYTVGEILPDRVNSNGVHFTINELRKQLNNIGVLNQKCIPQSYLRGSHHERLALLQGLMDTDGHFAKAVKQCVFVNTNPDITRGVMELCASLGIKATVNRQPSKAGIFPDGKMRISQSNFRIQFTADPNLPVFRLSRKASQQTNSRPTHWRRTKRVGIKSIISVESVPARCIVLDTPEHLFLCTEGMIPTHNSAQVEFGALQTKTPWVAPIEAIEQYMTYWETANQINHAFLPYKYINEMNPEKPIPPPIRAEPPQASPAFQNGMDTAFNQMMMASGQWQSQMGMLGNERTGAAIAERQAQADTATFHFQDNYAEGLRYTAKQLIDLIPKIYVTRQVRRILTDEGLEFDLVIDPAQRQAYAQEMDQRNEVIKRIFNPSVGRYDVAADVGPSLGTRREENVKNLTLVLTQAPALTGIIGDLLLKNMDFEDGLEAARRLRRMVPPQALGVGPTPTEQQLTQQLTAAQEALAKITQRAGADRIKLLDKDDKTAVETYRAETDRIMAMAKLLPEDAEGVRQLIEQLVQDSLATHLLPLVQDALSQQQPNLDTADASRHPIGVPGARQAPDGAWYLRDPTKMRGYLKVEPLAQEHKQPGIVGNA